MEIALLTLYVAYCNTYTFCVYTINALQGSYAKKILTELSVGCVEFPPELLWAQGGCNQNRYRQIDLEMNQDIVFCWQQLHDILQWGNTNTAA